MSITIAQNATAIAPGISTVFGASNGTEPYTYSVVAGGAGGTIGADTGIYAAPVTMGTTPQTLFDTILVTDADDETAEATIMVGSPLFLFCEILQSELGLANGRVYLWNQKIFQPTDDGLYIAVSEVTCKPFGNTIKPGADGWSTVVQSANMMSTLDINIMSRGPAARDRKAEVLLALNSIYAQSQQESNSFYIAKLPPSARFLNLSTVDGAAIPYRYLLSINIHYAVSKTKAVPYFDNFDEDSITTNS